MSLPLQSGKVAYQKVVVQGFLVVEALGVSEHFWKKTGLIIFYL